MNIKNILKNLVMRTKVYIVETGEENGWKYQKYSDGTYEASYRITLSSVNCTTAWGSVFRTAALAVGKPAFDHSSERSLQATFWRSGTVGVFGWVANFVRPLSADSGSWVVVSPGSGVVNGIVSITVKGQW